MTDIAYREHRYVAPAEVEYYPHPNCYFKYGCITDQYQGDVIAWLNSIDAYRETLQQIRERNGI